MTFPLGRTVATPGALDALNVFETVALLRRHAHGDWGDVCPEDRRANERALEHDERLFSVYQAQSGATIWIITEWDRSVTTILLPSEY